MKQIVNDISLVTGYSEVWVSHILDIVLGQHKEAEDVAAALSGLFNIDFKVSPIVANMVKSDRVRSDAHSPVLRTVSASNVDEGSQRTIATESTHVE